MTQESATTYRLEQTPDGVWRAMPVEGPGSPVEHIAGWEQVAQLAADHNVLTWSSTADLSRFRSQYGEPPAGLDTDAMQVEPPAE